MAAGRRPQAAPSVAQTLINKGVRDDNEGAGGVKDDDGAP